MALIELGDSLFDSGTFGGFKQTDQTLISVAPFSIPTGYVIGEHLAFELGLISLGYAPAKSVDIDLATSITFSGNPPTVLFDNTGDNPLFEDKVVNFAVSGATTGANGSTAVSLPNGPSLSLFPVGLVSQANQLKAMLQAKTEFSSAYASSDVVISAGSNDIFDLIDPDGDMNGNAPSKQVLRVLTTKRTNDDKALIDEITGSIVSNMASVVRSIRSDVGDIVILGPPSLDQTPLAKERWAPAAEASLADRGVANGGELLLGFVADIASNVNARLEDVFNKKAKPGIDEITGAMTSKLERWSTVAETALALNGLKKEGGQLVDFITDFSSNLNSGVDNLLNRNRATHAGRDFASKIHFGKMASLRQSAYVINGVELFDSISPVVFLPPSNPLTGVPNVHPDSATSARFASGIADLINAQFGPGFGMA